MDPSSGAAEAITDDWLAHHFDYLSPVVAGDLHPTLARMRSLCPITRSDEYVGYWIFTRYADILRTAQEWQVFSNEPDTSVSGTMTVRAIPEHVDPPLHREYKRLVNAYFTPAAVAHYEEPTRAIVTRLLDDVVELGRCDFMEDFATPFPGLAFFELALGAPSDDVRELSDLATGASMPSNPNRQACWDGLQSWIDDFVAMRRRPVRRVDDVVEAILGADIDGRRITEDEVRAMILLLILGGLETTAGTLGHVAMRFSREPAIPALLREDPTLVPSAVEELLRLDGSFLSAGRRVRCATEVHGQEIEAGDRVLLYWASANRDDAEFECPDEFRIDRPSNRHLAFGAGPHRCAGSSLARLNLRVAIEEVTSRLEGLRLEIPEAEIPFHHAFNRSPLRLPISFTPSRRLSG